MNDDDDEKYLGLIETFLDQRLEAERLLITGGVTSRSIHTNKQGVIPLLSRAGFTQTRALFRKNVGAPTSAHRNFCKGRGTRGSPNGVPSGVQGRSPGEGLGAKPQMLTEYC